MVAGPSRRALLAGFAVGLAGCAGNPTTSGPAGQTDPEITQLPAEEPALAWASRLPGPIAGSPAVSESRGHIYVGTGTSGIGTPVGNGSNPDREIFALQRSDGSVAWRADTSRPVTEQPIVHDGRVHVVIGRSDGHAGIDQEIVAYGQDGTRRWAMEPQDGPLSIVAAHDGNVFVGTSDDEIGRSGETLYAVDSDGEVQWEQEAGDAVGGAFADGVVLYDAGYLAVAAYDPADGTTVWQSAGKPIRGRYSNVTVIDGLCFREAERDSTESNVLIAHSTADGTEQWRYADASGSDYQFSPEQVTAVPDDAGAGAVDADIIGTEHSGAVFALTEDDGSELWTFQADTDIHTGAAVGDAAYVSDIDGTVSALSLSDGNEQWRISLPDAALLWAVSDGVVGYCQTEDEQTIASVAADGTERWSYTTSKDLTTPVVTDDRIYACAADGTVLAFVISSG